MSEERRKGRTERRSRSALAGKVGDDDVQPLPCLLGRHALDKERDRQGLSRVGPRGVGGVDQSCQARKTGDLGQIAALAFGEDEEKLEEAYQG